MGNIKETSQLPTTILGGDWNDLATVPYYTKNADELTKSKGVNYSIKKIIMVDILLNFKFKTLIQKHGNLHWYSTKSNLPQESLAEMKLLVDQFTTKYMADKKTMMNNQYQSEELIPYY